MTELDTLLARTTDYTARDIIDYARRLEKILQRAQKEVGEAHFGECPQKTRACLCCPCHCWKAEALETVGTGDKELEQDVVLSGEVLNSPVDVTLSMPIRLADVLMKYKVRAMRELLSLDWKALAAMKGMGRSSLKDLKEALREIGVHSLPYRRETGP